MGGAHGPPPGIPQKKTVPQETPTQWSQHKTPDGRPFYYNKTTKRSTYDKPRILMTKEELSGVGAWRQHITADGKAYYFNSVTKVTTWDKPLDFAKKAATTEITPEKTEELSYVYATPADAKKAFQDLVRESKITSSSTWQQVVPNIVNDPRYRALLSIGERKAAFHDLLDLVKKEERETERLIAKNLRETFRKMLIEIGVHMDWTYHKLELLHHDDPRYMAIKNDREREDLFRDYIAILEMDYATKKKAAFQAKTEAFEQFLNKDPTFNTTWKKVKRMCKDEPTFTELPPNVRLQVFIKKMQKLHEEEDNEVESKENAELRFQRKSREVFRAFLRAKVADGSLSARTGWEKFLEQARDTPAYKNMMHSQGSTPRDLYDDLLDTLEADYARSRKAMRAVFKSCHIVATSSSTLKSLTEALNEAGAMKEMKAAAGSDQHFAWYLQDQLLKTGALDFEDAVLPRPSIKTLVALQEEEEKKEAKPLKESTKGRYQEDDVEESPRWASRRREAESYSPPPQSPKKKSRRRDPSMSPPPKKRHRPREEKTREKKSRRESRSKSKRKFDDDDFYS